MQVPKDYYDEVFAFEGAWGMESKCGLKMLEKDGRPIVVATELYQDNPGTSVTQAGKSLAEQICRNKGLTLSDVRYLECNPDTNSKLSFYDEEYFEVTFNDSPQATYRLLSRDEVRALFD
jgi:hypothetical protein